MAPTLPPEFPEKDADGKHRFIVYLPSRYADYVRARASKEGTTEQVVLDYCVRQEALRDPTRAGLRGGAATVLADDFKDGAG